MIKLLFLFISWTPLKLSTNEFSDAERSFTNKSSCYEIFDDEKNISTSSCSEFKIAIDANRMKLTKEIMEHVPIIILQRHNHIRHIYNSPPLKLSKKLNDLSEQYVKKHASGVFGLMTDYLSNYGTNIYYGCRSYSHPNYIMDLWINESYLYDPKCSDEYNMKKMPHLSQILWKDTVAIGVSIASMKYQPSEKFALYILYDPPGNSVEDFQTNVLLSNPNLGMICYQTPFVVLLNFYLLHKFQRFIND